MFGQFVLCSLLLFRRCSVVSCELRRETHKKVQNYFTFVKEKPSKRQGTKQDQFKQQLICEGVQNAIVFVLTVPNLTSKPN